jgi:hypothetical protein
MKEHPILFSTPMVQAILENRKKQTRRVVKPQPPSDAHCFTFLNDDDVWKKRNIQNTWTYFVEPEAGSFPCNDSDKLKCPYGQPGDRIYVRETFEYLDRGTDDNGWEGYLRYVADEKEIRYPSQDCSPKRMPSIYMPKTAARIWLEVEEVKVERLQDISEEDAQAEGVKLHKEGRYYLDYIAEAYNTTQFIYRLNTAKQSFKSLWELVNERKKNFIEKHGICWIDNPWVWVIKFKIISTTGKPETI